MSKIFMTVPIEVPVETNLVDNDKVVVKIDTRFIDLVIGFLRDYQRLKGKVN